MAKHNQFLSKKYIEGIKKDFSRPKLSSKGNKHVLNKTTKEVPATIEYPTQVVKSRDGEFRKIESKGNYKSYEDIMDALNKRERSAGRMLASMVFDSRTFLDLTKVLNIIEVKSLNNAVTKDINIFYESSLRNYDILTERKHKKKFKGKRGLNASNSEFYERMQKLEERRNQKMLKLIIDREKREISQLKSSQSSKKR
jgi:hypothetical protein